MRYLIIGGGPAGLSAATMLRHADPNGEITILAKEDVPPYSRIALACLVTGTVTEDLLFLPLPPDVDLVLGAEAVRIDPENREVTTRVGKRYPYDRLLIATGAAPVRPQIEGSRLPFVFTIRDLGDVRAIRQLLGSKKTGRAVVAGAGPVGLELGDALQQSGFAVTFVVGSDRLFSTMLDRPAAAFLETKLAEQGVEIRKKSNISRILPSGDVILDSGDTLPSDLVIFGKGVIPSLDFLSGSGIMVRQGILVDQYLRTSVPGIYAAGDVAETHDIVHEESRVNALWPVAFEQGRVAARNMASNPSPYQGSFSRNILRVFGVSVAAAGKANADGAEVQHESGRDYFHKIVVSEGVLKGFVFLGPMRNEGVYVDLIRRKMRLDGAASLLHGTYGFAGSMKGSGLARSVVRSRTR